MASSDPDEPPPRQRFSLPQSALFRYKDIDREHQGLFDVVNRSAAEFAGSVAFDGLRFAAHVAELCTRMAAHFANEEQEMIRAGFDGAAAHAAHHTAVIVRLSTMHAEALLKTAIDMETMFELFDRVLDDVLRADLPFKDFLAAKGLITRD